MFEGQVTAFILSSVRILLDRGPPEISAREPKLSEPRCCVRGQCSIDPSRWGSAASQKPIKSSTTRQEWSQSFLYVCWCRYQVPQVEGTDLLYGRNYVSGFCLLTFNQDSHLFSCKEVMMNLFHPQESIPSPFALFTLCDSKQLTNWCIRTAWSLKWSKAGSTVSKVHKD